MTLSERNWLLVTFAPPAFSLGGIGVWHVANPIKFQRFKSVGVMLAVLMFGLSRISRLRHLNGVTDLMRHKILVEQDGLPPGADFEALRNFLRKPGDQINDLRLWSANFLMPQHKNVPRDDGSDRVDANHHWGMALDKYEGAPEPQCFDDGAFVSDATAPMPLTSQNSEEA